MTTIVTLDEIVGSDFNVAVIVTVPTSRVVTTPFSSTVAVASFDEDQVTSLLG